MQSPPRDKSERDNKVAFRSAPLAFARKVYRYKWKPAAHLDLRGSTKPTDKDLRRMIREDSKRGERGKTTIGGLMARAQKRVPPSRMGLHYGGKERKDCCVCARKASLNREEGKTKDGETLGGEGW